MTQRRWGWMIVLGGLGVIDLAVTVHARAQWHPAADDSQATVTLGQLLGFVTSIALLLISATILVVGWRAHRAHRRYERLRAFDGDTGPDITTW